MFDTRAPCFPLLASEEEEVLARLRLTARVAALLCGISPRQLSYWGGRGLLPILDGHYYGVAAIRKAMAIKRVMAQGFTLRKAVEKVDEQLAADETARAGYAALPVADLRTQTVERLDDLMDLVRATRQQLLAGRGSLASQAHLAPITPDDSPPLASALPASALLVSDAEPPASEAAQIALRLNRAIDELDSALSALAAVREAV